jgi:hypothetical protein
LWFLDAQGCSIIQIWVFSQKTRVYF